MLSDKYRHFLSACLLYELGQLTGPLHVHACAFTYSSERDCQVSMYHQSQLGFFWSFTCFPVTCMLNAFPTKGNFVKWYPQGLYAEQIHLTPDRL
jgi:hypothetical protein